MRYQVRIIVDPKLKQTDPVLRRMSQLGRVVFESEDGKAAYGKAEDLEPMFGHGLAIVDRKSGIVDWGDCLLKMEVGE